MVGLLPPKSSRLFKPYSHFQLRTKVTREFGFGEVLLYIALSSLKVLEEV